MKNSQYISCALLLCTITLTAAAQQSSLIEQRTITVLGTAEFSIEPDEAIIVFGIETENEDDINQARYQNDTTATAVLSLIRKLGIPDSAVQTGYLHVERRFHKGDFRDYQFSRTLTVKLQDLSKFETLLTGCLKLGVNSVRQSQLRCRNLSQYRKEAMRKAMQNAKEKAEAMCQVLGAKAGRPIKVMEIGAENTERITRSMIAYGSIGPGDLGLNEPLGELIDTFSAGRIDIKTQAIVIFEVE